MKDVLVKKSRLLLLYAAAVEGEEISEPTKSKALLFI